MNSGKTAGTAASTLISLAAAAKLAVASSIPSLSSCMVFRTGLQQSLHAFVTTKKDADWLLDAKIRWKCFRLDAGKMDV